MGQFSWYLPDLTWCAVAGTQAQIIIIRIEEEKKTEVGLNGRSSIQDWKGGCWQSQTRQVPRQREFHFSFHPLVMYQLKLGFDLLACGRIGAANCEVEGREGQVCAVPCLWVDGRARLFLAARQRLGPNAEWLERHGGNAKGNAET